jgi:exodeoxyribonuclease-1
MTTPTFPAWPQRPLFADRERPEQFVFLDIETSGLDRDFDQVAQLALVRTDADFRIVDPDRDVRQWRCRRLPWVVPAPSALIATRTELSTLDAEPLLPQEMMAEVAETLDEWGPAVVVGFNSIRFDIEFVRRAFFSALLNPYMMPAVGSLHVDAMVIAQAIHALQPGAITVPPLPEDPGAPRDARAAGTAADRRTFRLQALVEGNGLQVDASQAHDALADTMTTVALLRLMRERAPDVVTVMLDLASKWHVIEMLESASQPGLGGIFQPLAWLTVVGGITQTVPIMPLGPSPHQPGRFLAADLSVDPTRYLSLDDEALARFVSENRFAFPAIKANAQPILFPIRADDAGRRTDHDIATLTRRMAMIHAAMPQFGGRLASALAAAQPTYPPPVAVEQELYSGGFVARADALLAERMAQMQPGAIAAHVPALDDPRLREHARRWVYAADRTALSTSDRQRIDDLVRERLLGPGDQPWRTIAKARAEAMELRIAAAARGDVPATGHCDRIILELFFLEQRQLRALRARP